MSQKNKRMVVISEHNYEALRKLGTVTDSFDSVITQLLKAAKPIALEQQQQQEKLLQTNLHGVGRSSDQSAVVGRRTTLEDDTGHE